MTWLSTGLQINPKKEINDLLWKEIIVKQQMTWTKKDSCLLLNLWDTYRLPAEEIGNVFWVGKTSVYTQLKALGKNVSHDKKRAFSVTKLQGRKSQKKRPEKRHGS